MYSTELTVEIVTPVSTKYKGTVTEVVLPGHEGEMAVLGGHAPVVTLLSSGITVAVESASRKIMSTGPGFATIADNKVICLVDFAFFVDELDFQSLRKELDDVTLKLEKAPGDISLRLRKDQLLAKVKAESYGS